MSSNAKYKRVHMILFLNLTGFVDSTNKSNKRYLESEIYSLDVISPLYIRLRIGYKSVARLIKSSFV